MGSTLSSLRQTGLNVDLGLSSDSDDRFGDSSARNRFLQDTYRRLWPEMGRFVSEEITVENPTREYDVNEIQDLTLIELLDLDGNVAGRLSNYRLAVDETSDPPILRLNVPSLLKDQWTMRLNGYAPYSVPDSDSATSELPTRLEYIVVTGARAEAYRRRLNQYVDYNQVAVQNIATAVSAAELRDLYLAAKAEFEQLRFAHRRDVVGARRARRNTV